MSTVPFTSLTQEDKGMARATAPVDRRVRSILPRGLLVLVLAGMVAGCATSSPDVVQRRDAQRLSQVQDATLLSVRRVTIDGEQSGAGAAAGAVVGGIAGSTRSSGREQAALSVLGAVAGAVIGNAIERSSTRDDALELLVQLPGGERRIIVQTRGEEDLKAGDAVLLVTTGGKTRVTRNQSPGLSANPGPGSSNAKEGPASAAPRPPVHNTAGRP